MVLYTYGFCWEELFALARASLDISSAYHPQTGGQTERINQFLENYLRKQLKLSAKYYGLYKVVEKVGKIACKFELPPGSKIHPVFLVSLLKKKIGSKYFPSVNSLEFEDEVFKVYPAFILARRLIPRNNVGVPQVLIQWSHSSPDQATWEDYHAVAARFQEFDPWGQGSKKEKGNVLIHDQNTTLKNSRPIEGTY
ncbi:UNVERIFIED_CONTAM: hypothetical protein Scaly_2368500 [Sesamum calycinum]|uniref:Tf2-1-like SH3-like domain-containing protein n=1 Tax=Sesamum calycinum TaxID=2727403 RepID=A0AAW2LY31_9LAMI